MKNGTLWVWVLVIVLVALVAVYISKGNLSGSRAKTDFQAVFLSNGQVYFGKVSNETSPVVNVKDIYYLQVQKQIQPKGEEDAVKPEVKLVKLGNEIHGPVDEMRINRDHVLFVEDLKDDGKVVKAIKDFKANGEKAPEQK